MRQPATSYPHLAREMDSQVSTLRQGQPLVMDGFGRLARAATDTGVEETLVAAIDTGGGPSLMYSAKALEAFDQFQHKARD